MFVELARFPLLGTIALLAALCASPGCQTTVTVNGEAVRPKTDSEKALARRNLGIDHLVNGRTAMAIRELRVAEMLNPSDPVTHHWLGEGYRRRGILDKAETHVLRAIDLDPTYHDVRLSLSALYIQTERYEPAIEHCQILIDDPVFPSPWRALTNRGWAELQLGRVEDARNSLVQALDFHATYWPAMLNLGILEARQGNRVAAMEHFEHVLDLGPGEGAKAEANYRLAEIYVSLGRRAKALEHFEIAQTQAPKGLWGKRSLQYLELLR